MSKLFVEGWRELKESTSEEYIDILKDEWDEMIDRGRQPIIEFDTDHFYIEPDWENRKFYARSFSLGGSNVYDVEIDIDPDLNLDEHFAELYDRIVEKYPEFFYGEGEDVGGYPEEDAKNYKHYYVKAFTPDSELNLRISEFYNNSDYDLVASSDNDALDEVWNDWADEIEGVGGSIKDIYVQRKRL